ncbi:hypothetical protein ACOSP7_008046 [Xanthoceras sorbifolium]
MNPPLVVKPHLRDILLLYLAVSEATVCSALVKECEDKAQRPIYYVSKFLTKFEKNYSRLEKLAFALVLSSIKLRPYFQSHTISVVTNQPLRQFLLKPDVSRRLILWTLELIQFDIKYQS